jgi:hypothetical protein
LDQRVALENTIRREFIFARRDVSWKVNFKFDFMFSGRRDGRFKRA